jgi:hypothetical protein
MGTSGAQEHMNVGVHLGTQIVNKEGIPSDSVETDGGLRSSAANIGIISFAAQMITTVIGDSVTDSGGSTEWTVTLFLPGSDGAKTSSHEDTHLKVLDSGRTVAFRTIGVLYRLDQITKRSTGDGYEASGEHYKSRPLDVFGTTA